MREHEEAVRLKKEEEGEKVEPASLAPTTQGMRREGDEDAEKSKDKPELEAITDDTLEVPTDKSDSHATGSSGATTTTTEVGPHPPLTSIQRALLHPWLSHGLLPSPIKLYIHLIRLLLVPAPTLRAWNHSTNLDGLLLLDTLIWVVGMIVILILGPKLGATLRKIGHTLVALFSGRTGAIGAGGAGGLEAVKRLRRAPQAARLREHVHPRRNGIRTGAGAGVGVGANDAVPTREPGTAGRDAGQTRLERRAAGAVAEEGTGRT